MGEYKKQYYFLNFIGAMLLVLSMIITYYQETNIFFDFSMVIISFSLSIPIRFLVNQYMQIEQYNFINTLALNSLFKMMLMMIHFYVRAYNEQSHLGILTLYLQCNLLDLISLIVSYYLGKKHIKRYMSTYIVIVNFILIVAISGRLEVVLAEYLFRGSIVLTMIVTGVIYIKWRRNSYEILYERLPFFRVLLIYMMMNQLVSCFYIGQIEKYRTIMIAFQLIHVFYLFFSTFYICISSPWEERMHALNEAEVQIYEQSKNCDMIVNLSHELKTPVNVIRSALDMFMLDLEEDKIEAKMIEGIKDIKKECNIVMNIVQDMIDIQKINGHYIELKYQTYNLVEVIEHVMDAFSEEVSGSQLIFNPQEEEINAVVDGLLMQQCFMLLFGMFIQYDSNKKLFVEISQQHEKACIGIKIIHPSIAELEDLYKQMNRLDNDPRNVANILTLRLISRILVLHEGEIAFEKERSEKALWIYLKRKEVGEVIWLDNRSIAILNDQIRCRYIEV